MLDMPIKEAKMKRIRWEVRYDKSRQCWSIFRDREWTDGWSTKCRAVKYSAYCCRVNWTDRGELSELTIKNKNGQIGKGSSGRRTYGKDPRGTKG
jgi:Zn-finger nucleic acid-binding protein